MAQWYITHAWRKFSSAYVSVNRNYSLVESEQKHWLISAVIFTALYTSNVPLFLILFLN